MSTMGDIAHFVPGKPNKPAGLLSNRFHSIPNAVVRAYLEAYTQTGDLVVDPFCEGPTVLYQAVRAGCYAIGSSFNPLAMMVARLALSPPTRRHLDTAAARLGDTPRMGVPLYRHIESLYAVRCPRCDEATPADAFTWGRDTATIRHIHWQCQHCGHQAAPPTFGDKSMGQVIEQQGPHYWYAVDRIAPAGDPLRERAQQLLELYTPRNLYVLSSLIIKIESLFDDDTQQILKLLLLSCLDTCSSLHSPDSSSMRHRLRPTAHFLERNVWRAFVAAANEFPAGDAPEPFPLTDDLSALLDGGRHSPGAALFPFGINRLVASLPSSRVALVIANPPRPDPASWALFWLWTGWLFGHQAAAPLKPLLRQWRVDWDWYTRTMRAAFRALRLLLADDAPLVLVFSEPNLAGIEALTLALAGAGYDPAAWIRQVDTRAYRLTSRRAPSLPPAPADTDELADALYVETSNAVQDLIAGQGEPLTWNDLCLPVYQRLAESGLLGQTAVAEDLPSTPRAFVARQVQDALAGTPNLVCLEEATEPKGEPTSPFLSRWWLQDPGQSAPPLSTRVEATVHQILLSTLILTGDALAKEVYSRFPGDLTPEASLIETCLRSYGREITPGHWQLRSEDQPDHRAQEVAGIRHELRQLGERLDFEVSLRTETSAPGRLPAFDILWRDEGQPVYAFAIQWTARVHDILLAKPPAGVQPCLVIPGGRAELVAFKLQREPRLRQAVAEVGWQFIKYRHLRRVLAEKSPDRHTLKQIFGLDPIIEHDSAQMPLL